MVTASIQVGGRPQCTAGQVEILQGQGVKIDVDLVQPGEHGNLSTELLVMSEVRLNNLAEGREYGCEIFEDPLAPVVEVAARNLQAPLRRVHKIEVPSDECGHGKRFKVMPKAAKLGLEGRSRRPGLQVNINKHNLRICLAQAREQRYDL